MNDNTVPRLCLKRVTKGVNWWTVGKLYPIVNGVISDDLGDGYYVHQHDFSRRFIAVWLLPDGTELEALE